MDMDGVLIFLACFGRSLVYAGTLLTILDFLDEKGELGLHVCALRYKDVD